MRNEFSAYYRPVDSDLQQMWSNCIFVFDANVLLNLYRYSSKTSEQFLKVLENISDRVWITHQAAFEYQDRRLLEITQQERIFRVISEKLDNVQREIESLLSKGHLSILVDEIIRKIEKAKQDLLKHQEAHPNLFENDEIRNELTKIFEDKVGKPYSETKLAEIIKIGSDRYEKEIPPGYKDKGKTGQKVFSGIVVENKYGDLIQWFQLIDQGLSIQAPIIFITDDRKDDWWWIVNGKTVGPRPELVAEMVQKANVEFYMYQPEQFIKFANDFFRLKISKSSIDEVREFEEAKTDWKNLAIKALESLQGEADLSEIYDFVERSTVTTLPKSWQSQVRRALYNYSSDCEIYTGKEDLFLHAGKGRWALRSLPQG